MIGESKPTTSNATLTAAAALATAITMRLLNNGMTGMVHGNALTRNAVAASALTDVNKQLRGM